MKTTVSIDVEIPADSYEYAEETARKLAARLGPSAYVTGITLEYPDGRSVHGYFGTLLRGQQTESAVENGAATL